MATLQEISVLMDAYRQAVRDSAECGTEVTLAQLKFTESKHQCEIAKNKLLDAIME